MSRKHEVERSAPRPGLRPGRWARTGAARVPVPTSTCPTFRPSRSGTITSPTTPRRTPARSPTTTCWCRRSASTASPGVACSPTSTATTCRSGSWRATPHTPAHAGATVPRARRRSTSSTTRSGSSTRSSAPARAAPADGAASAGTTRWMTSPPASARRSSMVARTRSCTTSAVPARTVSRSAPSRPGVSTGTTRTPMSARPAPAWGWRCGPAMTAPARITPTRA